MQLEIRCLYLLVIPMDDEFRRIMEAQEALRRAINPLGYTDHAAEFLRRTQLDLGMSTFLRQEEERRRLLERAMAGQLSGQITALDHLAKQTEPHRRLLSGPMDDYRRMGAFDPTSPLYARLDSALGAYEKYAASFRLPESTESIRYKDVIAEKLSEFTRLGIRLDPAADVAMQGMRSPWLHRGNPLLSMQAFAETQLIGQALRQLPPYDVGLSGWLRGALGDWREVSALPPPIFDNPVARSDFYVSLGFDTALTDFTAAAFDESMALAELDEPDTEQAGLERNNVTYERLLRFERRVRAFIDGLMTAEFGLDWIKHQTPGGMYDDWKRKHAAAIDKGEEEQPLICYADFTDYIKIIERSDNWDKVFKAVFGRRQDVQESFLRLFPIRLCTMHARIITLDDELLMLVETKRILRAIERQ
jgi:hypothetical protein